MLRTSSRNVFLSIVLRRDFRTGYGVIQKLLKHIRKLKEHSIRSVLSANAAAVARSPVPAREHRVYEDTTRMGSSPTVAT